MRCRSICPAPTVTVSEKPDTAPNPKSHSVPLHRSKHQHGARIAWTRLFLSGVTIGLFFCRSSVIPADSVGFEFLFLTGLLLAVAGMAGRLWCSLFIAGRKNVELVTQGPYARCRHPLYFFSLLGAVGVALASGMLTPALVVAGAFAAYYPTVIRREDALLRRRHGPCYETYAEKLPAFWPRLHGAAVPEQWTCRPRIFLRHLYSAAWFPLSCALVHSLPRFREMLHLPCWFSLP